jgi:hypothetical protein
MQPLTLDYDYSRHSRQDQHHWLALQDQPKLVEVLRLIAQTDYLDLAQAVQVYGGSAPNARRVIKSNLVVRTLEIAFARAAWWLRMRSTDYWNFVPGHVLRIDERLHDPEAGFERTLPPSPGDFQQACQAFKSGIYGAAALKVGLGDAKAVYLVVDLNRTRSAYQELVKQLAEKARSLYYRSYIWMIVLTASSERAKVAEQLVSTAKIGGASIDGRGADQERPLPPLQPPLLDRLVQPHRDRGGDRVAVVRDDVHQLAIGDRQLPLEQPHRHQRGLVGDHQVDLGHRTAERAQQGLDEGRHQAGGLLEDRRPVHLEEELPPRPRTGRRSPCHSSQARPRRPRWRRLERAGSAQRRSGGRPGQGRPGS